MIDCPSVLVCKDLSVDKESHLATAVHLVERVVLADEVPPTGGLIDAWVLGFWTRPPTAVDLEVRVVLVRQSDGETVFATEPTTFRIEPDLPGGHRLFVRGCPIYGERGRFVITCEWRQSPVSGWTRPSGRWVIEIEPALP